MEQDGSAVRGVYQERAEAQIAYVGCMMSTTRLYCQLASGLDGVAAEDRWHLVWADPAFALQMSEQHDAYARRERARAEVAIYEALAADGGAAPPEAHAALRAVAQDLVAELRDLHTQMEALARTIDR